MVSEKRRKDKDIRSRIGKVATRLFCRKGYGSTSVSEIVKLAGVTKPMLYYYFGSKAGLFNRLFEEHFGAFHEILERILGMKGTTRDKVLQLTIDQFRFCRDNVDGLRFIMNTVMGPQKGIPRVRFPELNRINARLFAQILTEGIERREIKPMPIEGLGLAYIGMVNMFMMKQLGQKRWSLDEKAARQLVEVYFDGIGN
jgi:TetR/AcrR family transcriptional regulator